MSRRVEQEKEKARRTAALRMILHTPYKLGGTEPGVALDCRGVVCAIAEIRGLPPPDGWPSISKACTDGLLLNCASGFPDGWQRQPNGAALLDGDVLVYYGPEHPWAAIVHDGSVWSSSATVGSAYCMPLSRWRRPAEELWRWAP